MDAPLIYQRRPTPVRAIQWTGENIKAVRDVFPPQHVYHDSGSVTPQLRVVSHNGMLKDVTIGDILIDARHGVIVCDKVTFDSEYYLEGVPT